VVDRLFLVGLTHLSNDIVDRWQFNHTDLSFYVPRLQSLEILVVDVRTSLPIELVLAVQLVEVGVRDGEFFEF
jgi:hypothetical protein